MFSCYTGIVKMAVKNIIRAWGHMKESFMNKLAVISAKWAYIGWKRSFTINKMCFGEKKCLNKYIVLFYYVRCVLYYGHLWPFLQNPSVCYIIGLAGKPILMDIYKRSNINIYLLRPNCCTNIWEYCGSTCCYVTHLQQRQKKNPAV